MKRPELSLQYSLQLPISPEKVISPICTFRGLKESRLDPVEASSGSLGSVGTKLDKGTCGRTE
jgi:hypothetical protein